MRRWLGMPFRAAIAIVVSTASVPVSLMASTNIFDNEFYQNLWVRWVWYFHLPHYLKGQQREKHEN